MESALMIYYKEMVEKHPLLKERFNDVIMHYLDEISYGEAPEKEQKIAIEKINNIIKQTII